MNEDKARLELSIRVPRTEECHCATAFQFVVFWVNVKPACFANATPRWILGNGADVPDIQAIAIVGLVKIVAYDVLIVIDRPLSTCEVASVEWVLQIPNVEDMCRRQTFCHWADISIALVEFVVEEEVLLPGVVVYDTLMDILGSWERCPGDDVGHIASLVSDIVDCDSVLVVSIADISSIVARVWTSVDHTFCIVNVAIASSTTGRGNIVRVTQVQEDQASPAWEIRSTHTNGLVTANRATRDGVVELFVHNDIVRSTYWQSVPVRRKIVLGEVPWVGRIQR